MDQVTYLDGDRGVTQKIRKAMYNVCKEYLYIGFLLDEVKRYEYYLEKGYTSVYDYALQELGFKKSSVKNFIAVYLTFSFEQGGLHKMFLRDEYEEFNYSQLCEMLSLSPKARELVTPDMPVREIRALKKKIVGQTSGQVLFVGARSITANISNTLFEKLGMYVEKSGLSVDVLIENSLSMYLSSIFEVDTGDVG